MKNFHGNNRHGGGNRGFGGRDAGRPMTMHKATCSNCGKDCQLPFRPSGNRAVFCSTCFEEQKNGSSDRSEKKMTSKKLFEAVCGNCGDDCLVPFRPFPGKPVFCKKCFDRDDKVVNNTIVKTDNSNSTSIEQLKSQIEMLDIKLERILRMLTPEADRLEAADEEVKPAKKVAVKKTAKKKK